MTGEKVDTGIVSGIIVVIVGIVTSIQIAGAGNTSGSVPAAPGIAL